MMSKITLYLFFLLAACSLEAYFPIQCEGRTEIVYKSEKQSSDKHIICYTPVELNWDKKQILSQRNQQKLSPQIQFTDGDKLLYADNLQVEFESEQRTLNLKNLILQGNVKLIQCDIDPQTQELKTQYVLADQLRYLPKEDELFLTSQSDQYVYFYDEVNDYEMNAKEIVVTRNETSKKNCLIGKGAVHFSFKEDLLTDFKKNKLKGSKKEKLK